MGIDMGCFVGRFAAGVIVPEGARYRDVPLSEPVDGVRPWLDMNDLGRGVVGEERLL